MATLIIESKNPGNLKVLAAMAKQLGDYVKAVHTEDLEDLLFGNMMEKAKTGKKVSRAVVMKALDVE
jgi:hypothetical protein